MPGLILALLLSGAAHAKDPCKAWKEADDPLEGRLVGFAQYFDPGHYSALDMQYREKGGWTMHLMVVARGVVDSKGAPGELAKIAIGDKVVEIPASKESPPIANANTSSVFTQWIVEYKPTDEQLAALQMGPVEAIGLTVAGSDFRLPISEKDAKKLHEKLACIPEIVK